MLIDMISNHKAKNRAEFYTSLQFLAWSIVTLALFLERSSASMSVCPAGYACRITKTDQATKY